MRCYLRSCSLRSFSTSDCYRLVFTHFSYFLPSTLRDFPPIYLWNLHHAACNNSYISRSLKGLMPRGVLIPIIFVQCHIVNRPQWSMNSESLQSTVLFKVRCTEGKLCCGLRPCPCMGPRNQMFLRLGLFCVGNE